MKGFWDKLEKIFLFLFLFLIPTQLGRHFWPEWSGVNGIRVDYLSPTLYLVDLVWFGWVGTNLITNCQLLITSWKKIFSFRNLVVLLFVGVNIILAGNRWVAAYKWLRIGQWWVTYILFKNLEFKNLKNYLKWIIPCWVVVEAFLVVGQVAMGHSVGGIFYWLGERRFSFNTIGVAQMSWWGSGVIRAYGTFSHPNSLAGFMLVCWLIWNEGQIWGSARTIKYWIVWWLMVLVMVLAGSRIVWLLAALKLLITNDPLRGTGELRIKNSKKKKGWVVLGVGVLILIVGLWGRSFNNGGLVGGWDSDSLTKRLELNVAAIGMIRDNPLFGVGAGNFLNKLPVYQQMYKFYWLQPVHNIFLLVWSEIGSLGVIIAIQLLITNDPLKGTGELRIKNKMNLWILGAILVTGLVDHYWLTLPQNSWLLAVVLAIL